jgi:hypothetical protein
MSDNISLEPQYSGELYHPSTDFIAKAKVQVWESETIRTEHNLEGYCTDL